MTEVGIRALKQNASAVVARAAGGETLVITDRGRPTAQLSPLPASAVDRLIASGQARPARRRLADLPAPPASRGRSISEVLQEMRDAEDR